MQHPNIVEIVARWSDAIVNGRTDEDVLASIRSEVDELAEEVDLAAKGEPAGIDGKFGEAVDILASTLDVIRRERPDASIEDLTKEVADYLEMKCRKWARKYGQGV